MSFVFWGDGSQASMNLVDSIRVRSTENFNWTFIFILAVVFYVYWSEFNKKNTKFVYLLHHTNFEDAQENEATQFFAELYKQDPCISLFWLNGVYTDNQKDVAVLEGILRIISMLDAPEYRKYILPMVKASFNDTHVEVQEAAIMVAENWRNKMCLDALTSTQFASNWIKDYANQVIEELREELADEISQDD